MSTERTGQIISIASALQRLAAGDGVPSWDDEQWKAHDARIAAARDEERRAAAAERLRQAWPLLLEAGFPRRAVEAAKCADASRSTVAKVEWWDATAGSTGGDGPTSGDPPASGRDRSVLVISGPAGCGKTVAATWWAARQERTPAFVRASTFAASSRYDRDTRASWFRAPALVLDDLGTEYLDSAGSFLVDLDELVDVFYGDRKPLLITTNCKIDDFRTRYGQRIVDRIRECGVFWSTDDASMRGSSAP